MRLQGPLRVGAAVAVPGLAAGPSSETGRRARARQNLQATAPMSHPRITGTLYGEDPGSVEDQVHPDALDLPLSSDPPRKWCSGDG